MTPKEALELLDNIVSRVQLSREDHDKVKEATKVLKELIVKK